MCLNSPVGLERILEIADRFEAAWRQDLHPRIEELLETLPQAHRHEVLLNLLRIELEIRRERGESPRLEDYLERFPLDREAVMGGFARDESDGAASDRGAAAPSAGSTMPIVPGYRVVRLLGSGGFSEVWLAEDENLFNRPVALKMIRARTPAHRRGALLEALRGEAELLVHVRHPNLVQVLHWLESEDDPVLVLQYIPGGSLADRLQREGPLDWQTAARYAADVGEGLLSAHARGIIHRDIKPANILWDPETDEAILTDLGVGVRLADPKGPGGTIPYMAPEAFEGRISPALDVYGLAATLFTFVTGERPFSGTTIDDLCRQVRQGLPEPDPRCAGMPEPLEKVVRSGLDADPARRPDVPAFVAALRGTLNQLLAGAIMMKPTEPRADATTEPSPDAQAEDPAQPTTEPEPHRDAGVSLRLLVSRQVGPSRFVPIAAARASIETPVTRDMRKVPPAPEQVQVRTGDRVRIEVVADRPGFITVFNIGPSGNLSLLYPDESFHGQTFAAPVVRANQPVQIQDVELTPPAGRERLLAVWSREPLPLRLDRLQSLVESKKKTAASRPYVATRDMKRVQKSVEQLDPADWHAVTLELDHRP